MHTVVSLPVKSRMSTQGSTSDPVSPVGSMCVRGIGWTLAPPAGSGRTGAGQSSFRLASLHASGPAGPLGLGPRLGRTVGIGVGVGSGVASASGGAAQSLDPEPDFLSREIARAEVLAVRLARHVSHALRRFEQRCRLLAERDLGDLPGSELARDGLTRVISQRRPGAQDQPGLDVEPDLADAREVVRGASRNVFGADVAPARCRGPIAGLTRIPLHLAARPFLGIEDGPDEHPRVVSEGLVARFDPDRLGLDARHPADAAAAEDRVAGGLGRLG